MSMDYAPRTKSQSAQRSVDSGSMPPLGSGQLDFGGDVVRIAARSARRLSSVSGDSNGRVAAEGHIPAVVPNINADVAAQLRVLAELQQSGVELLDTRARRQADTEFAPNGMVQELRTLKRQAKCDQSSRPKQTEETGGRGKSDEKCHSRRRDVKFCWSHLAKHWPPYIVEWSRNYASRARSAVLHPSVVVGIDNSEL